VKEGDDVDRFEAIGGGGGADFAAEDGRQALDEVKSMHRGHA